MIRLDLEAQRCASDDGTTLIIVKKDFENNENMLVSGTGSDANAGIASRIIRGAIQRPTVPRNDGYEIKS